jgi:hypothetical protein
MGIRLTGDLVLAKLREYSKDIIFQDRVALTRELLPLLIVLEHTGEINSQILSFVIGDIYNVAVGIIPSDADRIYNELLTYFSKFDLN